MPRLAECYWSAQCQCIEARTPFLCNSHAEGTYAYKCQVLGHRGIPSAPPTRQHCFGYKVRASFSENLCGQNCNPIV